MNADAYAVARFLERGHVRDFLMVLEKDRPSRESSWTSSVQEDNTPSYFDDEATNEDKILAFTELLVLLNDNMENANVELSNKYFAIWENRIVRENLTYGQLKYVKDACLMANRDQQAIKKIICDKILKQDIENHALFYKPKMLCNALQHLCVILHDQQEMIRIQRYNLFFTIYNNAVKIIDQIPESDILFFLRETRHRILHEDMKDPLLDVFEELLNGETIWISPYTEENSQSQDGSVQQVLNYVPDIPYRLKIYTAITHLLTVLNDTDVNLPQEYFDYWIGVVLRSEIDRENIFFNLFNQNYDKMLGVTSTTPSNIGGPFFITLLTGVKDKGQRAFAKPTLKFNNSLPNFYMYEKQVRTMVTSILQFTNLNDARALPQAFIDKWTYACLGKKKSSVLTEADFNLYSHPGEIKHATETINYFLKPINSSKQFQRVTVADLQLLKIHIPQIPERTAEPDLPQPQPDQAQPDQPQPPVKNVGQSTINMSAWDDMLSGTNNLPSNDSTTPPSGPSVRQRQTMSRKTPVTEKKSRKKPVNEKKSCKKSNVQQPPIPATTAIEPTPAQLAAMSNSAENLDKTNKTIDKLVTILQEERATGQLNLDALKISASTNPVPMTDSYYAYMNNNPTKRRAKYHLTYLTNDASVKDFIIKPPEEDDPDYLIYEYDPEEYIAPPMAAGLKTIVLGVEEGFQFGSVGDQGVRFFSKKPFETNFTRTDGSKIIVEEALLGDDTATHKEDFEDINLFNEDVADNSINEIIIANVEEYICKPAPPKGRPKANQGFSDFSISQICKALKPGGRLLIPINVTDTCLEHVYNSLKKETEMKNLLKDDIPGKINVTRSNVFMTREGIELTTRDYIRAVIRKEEKLETMPHKNYQQFFHGFILVKE